MDRAWVGWLVGADGREGQLFLVHLAASWGHLGANLDGISGAVANLGLRGRPRYPVSFLYLRGFAHAAGPGLGPRLDWAILGHLGDDHFEPS